MKTRNSEVLKDFVKYCKDNPEQRFWQALRNWSGHHVILVYNAYKIGELPPNHEHLIDTFYWEGKNENL